MRPIMVDVNGWIHYVCPECWKQYDYIDFSFKVPATVN